jgi:beta-N-acetylhexosaminidase
MTSRSIEPAPVLLPGFVGTELPEWLAVRLRGGLGGVCLFAENITSPQQLRALTAAIRAANPRALIAIDEEGGDVSRLHAATGSPYPGNAVLGRIDDTELTASVGAAVATELRAAGVNLNFAPDADINSDPDNPVIGVRSFGTDAALVARHTAAWVAAHEAQGVAVTARHFPGHGETYCDSHHALPVVGLPLVKQR